VGIKNICVTSQGVSNHAFPIILILLTLCVIFTTTAHADCANYTMYTGDSIMNVLVTSYNESAWNGNATIVLNWNKTYADTLYYNISNPLNFINQSQTDNLYYNKTTCDNKYLQSYTEVDPRWQGNATTVLNWNKTYADTLYAPIHYGDDWNKTYADTLYYSISNPLNFINTSYNSTYASFIQDNTSWNQTLANTLYYGITNQYNYWNSTFATFNKTYADTLYTPATFNKTYADTLYYSITNPLNFINTSYNSTYDSLKNNGNWSFDKPHYVNDTGWTSTFVTLNTIGAGTFSITTTANFDSGTKTNVTTTTDELIAGANQFSLGAPVRVRNANEVSYWSMDDNTGVSVTDNAGGNTGTLYGAVWVTGQFGYGIYFNGTSLYNVTIPASTEKYNFTENQANFTIATWIKLDSPELTVSDTIVDNSKASTTNKGVTFSYYNGSGHIRALRLVIANGTSGGALNAYSSSNAIPDTNWHYAVVTTNTTHALFYVDGVAKGVAGTIGTLPTGASTYVLSIGSLSGAGTTSPLNGTLDGLAIYNRTLTPAEITVLYNGGKNYYQNGNWTSATQTMNIGQSLISTTIAYSGVNANNYISKVDWLIGGVVQAEYNTAINSGSSIVLTNSNLTSGTFSNVNSSFTVEIFLVGNNTNTPSVTSITGTATSSQTVSTIKLASNTTVLTCNATNEGVVYYDGGVHNMYFCNSTEWRAMA